MPGRLVWLNGNPTAGKTWLCDYLAKYHGFLSIDGDEELHLYQAHTDEGDLNLKSITTGFTKHFTDYVLEGKGAGPEELWKPFYERALDRTKKLRQAHPDADISVGLAAYPRAVRDFIRERIKENVSFVALTVSVEAYATASRARMAKFCEAQSMTDEQVWNMFVSVKYPDVPYTGEAGWMKHFAEHPDIITNFEKSDDHLVVIPTSDGDRGMVAPKAEEALGLTHHSGPIDVDAVSQLNFDRFKAYAEERKRRHELRSSSKTK